VATRRGAGLPMPDEALLDNPQLVRIAPVPTPNAIRSGKNFDLGSECKVGHKNGRIIAAKNPSDGPRRRDTKKLCLTITSERIEGRGRCYMIAEG